MQELKLSMAVADLILEVVDASPDMPRGDVQGVTEATAQKIIALVRAS